MGCPLDGGDNVKIEKKYYALDQGGFCGMHKPYLPRSDSVSILPLPKVIVFYNVL